MKNRESRANRPNVANLTVHSTQTTSVAVYGGLNEIGGNKIVLKAADGRAIFLDFGFEFRYFNDYFDEFLPIRKTQVLFDGFQMGFLPLPDHLISGIYRPDLWAFNEQQIHEIFPYMKNDSLKITHVLISHCHGDHIGSIRYLNPQISLVCGKISKSILKFLETYSKSGTMFSDILRYGVRFQIDEKGGRMNKKSKNFQIIWRKIYDLPAYYQGDLEETCSFEVQFFPVDHSLPGAGAYFLEDKITKKRIVYTGDLRFHGRRRDLTEKFISAAQNFHPDLLITEGTRLGRIEAANPPNQDNFTQDIIDNKEFNKFATENDVCKELARIIRLAREENREGDSPKLILFTCAGRDTNRLESFFLACKSQNRSLVLLPKSYLFLKLMVQLGQTEISEKEFEEIRVFLPKKGWGVYEAKDYSRSPDCKAIYNDSHQIRAQEIHQNPSKFCLQLSFYNLTDLLDIRPPAGSHWIRSESEPFTDEAEIKMDKLLNWLDIFQITPSTIHNAHCSGHLSPEDLEKMIQTINPKKILVIHSEHPEILSKLSLPDKIEIITPSKGKEMVI
ncbi:MAG: hypothetical protein DRO88_09635 [Promethearchaeia archaeon]|nr:MAG: hypothetical protein DRO88_09635 [Candidatus Lokiarchaeia archaeon]